MQMHPPRIVAIGLMLAMCACGGNDEPRELVVGQLIRERLAALADTTGYMASPAAMAVWRDSLALIDMVEARVHLLPMSLEGGRSFGERGSGPGEMLSPQGVAVSGDTLVVFDRGNGRFVRFLPSGSMVDQRLGVVFSTRPKFIDRPSGTLIPIMSEVAYAQLDSAGHVREVFSRSATEGVGTRFPVPSHMLVESGDTDFLIDPESGVVMIPVGNDTLGVLLPAAALSQLDPEIERIREMSPERESYPIVAAGPAPGGVVVWFLPSGPLAGAMVTRTGEWRLIRGGSESEEVPPYPSDIMVLDDELVVLHGDGVRVYHLFSH